MPILLSGNNAEIIRELMEAVTAVEYCGATMRALFVLSVRVEHFHPGVYHHLCWCAPQGLLAIVYLTVWTLSPQGKLSLHNDCSGTEHLFTLRGVGEHPLPEDHVVLHCPVWKTTHTQLDVPNYSHDKVTLKVISTHQLPLSQKTRGTFNRHAHLFVSALL